VKALQNWRHYLAGSPHDVTVHTNHTNLQYWQQPHKINHCIARQVLELGEFPIKLKHVAGKTNGRADALSRHSDHDQGDHDNENVTVLPDGMLIQTGTTSPPNQDKSILRPWVNAHNLKKHNGEWWKDNRKVITAGLEARRKLICNYHNLHVYRHPGIACTTQLISQYLWWPRLASKVLSLVKGCAKCQQNKVNTQAQKAPLSPIYPSPSATPFSTISLNFIVKLPLSEGYDSILTITDQGCTEMAIFIPCLKAIDAEGVAKLYLCVMTRRILLIFHFIYHVCTITDRSPD
jgi:hypothetical protein